MYMYVYVLLATVDIKSKNKKKRENNQLIDTDVFDRRQKTLLLKPLKRTLLIVLQYEYMA